MLILSVAAMLLPPVDRDPPASTASSEKKCRTLPQSSPSPAPNRMQKLNEMPRGGIMFAELHAANGCEKQILASHYRRWRER